MFLLKIHPFTKNNFSIPYQYSDFYYDYQSFIPGTLVRTTGDLVKVIRTEEFATEKIQPFVNYFFDHQDGKSSARVVDQILLATTEE